MSRSIRDSHVHDTAIFTVHSHPIVQIGLADIVHRASGLELVGQASSGREAQRLVEEVEPHVVLLDSTLPDMDGLELLRTLKLRNERLGAAVISVHRDRDSCVRALRAGAAAYVTKGSPADDIVRALRCAALGRRFVSTDMTEQLATLADADLDRKPHERLSDRELEVLRRLTEGMRISEIASCLCLSIKTVSTYRTRVLKKLAVPSTAHLVRYAIEHGLST